MIPHAVRSSSSPSLMMNVGTILQEDKGTLQAWNKEAEEILGLMPERMQELQWLRFSIARYGLRRQSFYQSKLSG
jgi:PAS domain-containing protein